MPAAARRHVETLVPGGVEHLFTLSGNQILSVYDAAIGRPLALYHTRHEAAAVHMADAWGRLTGEPGVALVTGGPGHANAVGALFTALAAESPMVLLSGHAATWELGRGGFQELRQADMAAPVTKASWTAKSAADLGALMVEAMRIAVSGRPGPVHVSLPSDLLDARVPTDAVAWPTVPKRVRPGLADAAADAVLAAIGAAQRPLIVAGPMMSSVGGRELLARLEAATNTPCVIVEIARGMADATLGAFVDVAQRVDLVVLLGKALDFTLQWAKSPAFDAGVKLIAIDPEPALVERAVREAGSRLAASHVAHPARAAETLVARAANGQQARDDGWLREARAMLDGRPEIWQKLSAQTAGRLHPAEVFRTLRPYVERDPDTVLICDGGEFAQWGQGMLPVRRRLVNGVAGAIGASLPFAIAARMVEPKAPVFAVLGDGTFGFHMADFETAVRRNLPFVAVLGNDACWNAESQIQLREYGQNRQHGCELLPARYDQVVAALGGHGELVARAADLAPALERALASGKPACVNVMIESVAAPAIRLS